MNWELLLQRREREIVRWQEVGQIELVDEEGRKEMGTGMERGKDGYRESEDPFLNLVFVDEPGMARSVFAWRGGEIACGFGCYLGLLGCCAWGFAWELA